MKNNNIKFSDQVSLLAESLEMRLFSLYSRANEVKATGFLLFSLIFNHIQILSIFFNAKAI